MEDPKPSPPKNGVYIVQGEMLLVVTAIRRSSKLTTHLPQVSIYYLYFIHILHALSRVSYTTPILHHASPPPHSYRHKQKYVNHDIIAFLFW